MPQWTENVRVPICFPKLKSFAYWCKCYLKLLNWKLKVPIGRIFKLFTFFNYIITGKFCSKVFFLIIKKNWWNAKDSKLTHSVFCTNLFFNKFYVFWASSLSCPYFMVSIIFSKWLRFCLFFDMFTSKLINFYFIL